MKCRLCGRTVFECGDWLERVNEKGVAGIWECRPACGAKLTNEEAIIGAIEAAPNEAAHKTLFFDENNPGS